MSELTKKELSQQLDYWIGECRLAAEECYSNFYCGKCRQQERCKQTYKQITGDDTEVVFKKMDKESNEIKKARFAGAIAFIRSGRKK